MFLAFSINLDLIIQIFGTGLFTLSGVFLGHILASRRGTIIIRYLNIVSVLYPNSNDHYTITINFNIQLYNKSDAYSTMGNIVIKILDKSGKSISPTIFINGYDELMRERKMTLKSLKLSPREIYDKRIYSTLTLGDISKEDFINSIDHLEISYYDDRNKHITKYINMSKND